MSLKIGTNLDYQGHDFLDKRQGLPKSLADLRNWDILVPLGFEACVSGEWYIWKGLDSEFDSETGHWRKRASDMGTDYSDSINKLLQAVFPAEFKVYGGGTYEKGQTQSVNISWSLTRDGVSIQADSIRINGNYLPNANVSSWSPNPSTISTTTSYTVEVQSSEGTYSDTVNYEFLLKRYWGASANIDSVTPDLRSLSNELARTWVKGENTTFDCTGGKYPFYIVPQNLYDASSFQMWIGGLRNTDFGTRVEELQNASGSTDSYIIIWLRTLQTGVLSIKFTNV